MSPGAARLAVSCLLALPLAGWGPLPVEIAAGPADPVADTSAPPAERRDPTRVFDHLMITGGGERVASTPGSAHLLTRETMAVQGQGDVHRILRQVPGVNIQEEEGYGLRPNIGMRGSGVERSSKITLLEDGVLIAPAPYAAPAAYYFPTPGRMEAIEVRKGSSAVRQGPFTLGGVLNLVSTSIPSRSSGRAELELDDRGGGRLHAHAGASGERLGWLVESYQLDTPGFKRLDNGGPTGVELADYVAKLRLGGAAAAARQQLAELKLGMTRQRGYETYLGLTLEDFGRSPFRRYVASAEDRIDTEHEQVQLRYLLRLGRRLDLTATAYDNRFERNWHKLESVGGVGIAAVLAEPDRFTAELALLRGERDAAGGALAVRNNRRHYRSRGAELVLGLDLGGERTSHRLELGLRRHRDEEDRFQEDDLFGIVAGEMALVAPGAPGSQANRITGAEVWAVYLEDEIRRGRWTVVPGIRFESVDFTRRDFGRDDPDRRAGSLELERNGIDVLIPGLGISYGLGGRWTLVGGVYKGFAPPGPGRDGRTEAEESVNYEAGVRYRHGPWRGELIGFFNDYENLLGRDTLSGGGAGTGDLFNGGEVLVRGLEASLGGSFGDGRLGVPVTLSYTWTRGEFRSSFTTGFADWAPAVAAGDELPYLPEHQAHAMVGLERGPWGAQLALSYSAAMRTAPGTGPLEPAGSIGDHLVGDLAVERRLAARWRLFARLRNLSDEVYVVALRPAGARPGLPRTLLVGGRWEL